MSKEFQPPEKGRECPPGFEFDAAQNKCLPKEEEQKEAARDEDKECPPGQEYDEAKGRCAPKEEERDEDMGNETNLLERLGRIESILETIVTREEGRLQAEEQKLAEGLDPAIYQALKLIPSADARLKALSAIKVKLSAPMRTPTPEVPVRSSKPRYSKAQEEKIELEVFGMTFDDYIKETYPGVDFS